MSPPTPTLGRVFLSSVFGGMMELRKLAGEMAELVDLEPVLAEEIPAKPGSVESVLEGLIQGCDTYVGVFDTRRGTVPADEDPETNRAITEREFLLARQLGLRCYVFLSDAENRDPGLQEFLDEEVTHYKSGVWSGYYASREDLAKGLVAALAQARPSMRLELENGQATLHLENMKPVWDGPDTLQAEVDLSLSPAAEGVRDLFLGGVHGKTASEDGLRILGAELFERAFPGDLGPAVTQLLGNSGGRLVLLELEAEDADIRYLPWELLRMGAHTPVREGNLEVVRRLPSTGHTPKLPADHLSVLGFTASSIEDRKRRIKLGLEGGLQEDADLFWEKEQETLLNALAPLISTQRARLVLPDEGSQNRLRRELAREDRPRILHVSCHGSKNDRGEPALCLENDDGYRAYATAGDLLGWYRATPGAEPVELAVLSSCYTAAREPGDVGGPGRRAVAVAAQESTQVASLAEDLATGGITRTLGMQTSVSDRGAMAFAKAFYETLAQGTDLPCALRAGRQALQGAGSPHEWAIPVLLSTGDVGPLVSPRRQQTSVDEALVSSRESPYAMGQEEYLTEGYAGRRDFERRLSRAVAEETTRPIAIHGLGGLGKSTLAIRFLQRRVAANERVWALAVEERLPPEALEAEVLKVLGIKQPEGVPEDQAREMVRAAIQQVLQAQRCHLLLDNFEVQQHEDGSWIDEGTGHFLRDLKKLGGRDFTLLVTTRLELPDARNLDLGELPASALRKFRLQRPPLERLQAEEWDTVVEHLGGHPKALEILAGYLQDHPERKRKILKAFEDIREHVHGKLSEDDQAKGRKLLVQQVLDAVPGAHRPTFDRLCLLRAPLPTEEILDLLEAEGFEAPEDDLEWLRQRGLLARTVAPSALLGGDMVHRLLADPWEDALAAREGDEAVHAWHRRVAEHFAQREGLLSDFSLAAHHLDAAGDRAGAMEMYNWWAHNLQAQHAYRASEQVSREGLNKFFIVTKSKAKDKLMAAMLWMSLHDAVARLGEVQAAQSALRNADQEIQGLQLEDTELLRASIALRRGQLLKTKGEGEAALEDFEFALAIFKRADKEVDCAIALGEIARLKAQSGDICEALELHTEELTVYRRFGDLRKQAITIGDIARLRFQTGKNQEALELYGEQMEILEHLGDIREIAVALGYIARVKAQAGCIEEAIELFEQQYRVFDELGETQERALVLQHLAHYRGLAGDMQGALDTFYEVLDVFEEIGDIRNQTVVLISIAQLEAKSDRLQRAFGLYRRALTNSQKIRDPLTEAIVRRNIAILQAENGQEREARVQLDAQREVFEKLGEPLERAITLNELAKLESQRGNNQIALRLWHEQLKLCEKIGAARERALALGGIAQISVLDGDLDRARDLQEERLQINEKLQDLDGIAAASFDLALLDLKEDQNQEALPRLLTAWNSFKQLERVDGVASVGAALGSCLAARGRKDEAEEVLAQSEAAFRKLGMEAQADQVKALREGLGGEDDGS